MREGLGRTNAACSDVAAITSGSVAVRTEITVHSKSALQLKAKELNIHTFSARCEKVLRVHLGAAGSRHVNVPSLTCRQQMHIVGHSLAPHSN